MSVDEVRTVGKGKHTGVSAFIDGHHGRELVHDGTSIGDVGSHGQREFGGEGLADSGSRRDGSSSGEGGKSSRQDGNYGDLHRDGNVVRG